MRKLTQEELKTIRNEEDMLQGNINRMCVTNNLIELDTMLQHAKERIKLIRDINYKRMLEDER